jgi:hypothetical protein
VLIATWLSPLVIPFVLFGVLVLAHLAGVKRFASIPLADLALRIVRFSEYALIVGYACTLVAVPLLATLISSRRPRWALPAVGGAIGGLPYGIYCIYILTYDYERLYSEYIVWLIAVTLCGIVTAFVFESLSSGLRRGPTGR